MIRLKDELGRWVSEVVFYESGEIASVSVSQHEDFAKLFREDEYTVKYLVDEWGFEVVRQKVAEKMKNEEEMLKGFTKVKISPKILDVDSWINDEDLHHIFYQDALKSDIVLHGVTIKNIPVYPDSKGNPSENVTGETLAQLYELLKSNKNKSEIEYYEPKKH